MSDIKQRFLNWFWYAVVVRVYPNHSTRVLRYAAQQVFSKYFYEEAGEKACLEIAKNELRADLAKVLLNDGHIKFISDYEYITPTSPEREFMVRAILKISV